MVLSQTTLASVEKWTSQEARDTCGLDQNGNSKKWLHSASVFQVAH